jgi:hypothetical protein
MVIAFPSGTDPISAAVGFFNNDAMLDVAVANRGTNNVSILLGNGDGTFQPRMTYAAGLAPVEVEVADFDNNGVADLAIPNLTFLVAEISVLLGNGDGSFQPRRTFRAGPVAVGVAAGDFNLDGAQDLAVANRISADISVLLGNGDGTFQNEVRYRVGSTPERVVVGNFNGDFQGTTFVVRQTQASSVFLNETVLSTSGLVTGVSVNGTGSLDGVMEITGLRVATVTTGAFAGKGFLTGTYEGTLAATPFSGELATASFALGQGHVLKGATSGDIVGTLEGSLTESISGSGVLDRLSMTWTLSRVKNVPVTATLVFAGTVSYTEPIEHPSTQLRFYQAAMVGDAKGQYTGPLCMVLTSMTALLGLKQVEVSRR